MTSRSDKHRIVLLVGGARSGKSTFADNCGRGFSRVIYFATARRMSGDGEMNDRIAKHVARRPQHWKTMEPPSTFEDLLALVDAEKPEAVIIDCATLWLGWEMSRVFQQYTKQQLVAHMENEITHFIEILKKIPCPVFVVSNETGCGVVPEHPSGRIFRDCQGLLNSSLSAESLFTLFFISGNGLLVHNATQNSTQNSTSNSEGYTPIAAVTPEWVVLRTKT